MAISQMGTQKYKEFASRSKDVPAGKKPAGIQNQEPVLFITRLHCFFIFYNIQKHNSCWWCPVDSGSRYDSLSTPVKSMQGSKLTILGHSHCHDHHCAQTCIGLCQESIKESAQPTHHVYKLLQ